jgi:V/A-type H+-transporting ATPase subunit I
MITKMDKYSFIIFHSELDSFLEKVRELGMVDITRENKAIDDTSGELFSLDKRYTAAVKSLESTYNSLPEDVKKSSDKKYSTDKPEEKDVLEQAETALQDKELFKQEMENLVKELRENKPWGKFTRDDIRKINQLGYSLHLYVVSEKSYDKEWEQNHAIKILNKTNGKIYFALVHPTGEEFTFDLPESKIPPRSYDQTEEMIKDLSQKTAINNLKLASLYLQIPELEKQQLINREKLDLYLASNASVKEAEGTLALLSGFAPVENREKVTESLDKSGIYYLIEEARETDDPPVKLKNGFFARLYEPIGELYMLPRYGELDLTPYFAPFYMLFFGMCLGDMGYGLTILIASGLAKLKFPKFKSYLTLAQFLGLGAVIMAALSGVFFGTKIQDIIPMPESIRELFFTDLKMFWFAIIFGLVQIVFARLLNAIDSMIRKGWQYGIHNIGWSIVIVWAAWYYATTMSPDILMPQFMDYIAIAGAAMILFFSSDSGNIFTRVAKGTIAFYDVTSIFGDMLSYIRLFGLGTAGAILGMVVNSVAMSMTGIPYLGWFFAGLMLVFGHIMVLLLSSLGAFVHPMRLTFVEFYKNASFTGGGREYRPLRRTTK